MKLAIITHVPHIIEKQKYFAYAPYVREMNIWGEHVDSMILVAPEIRTDISAIEECYTHTKIEFKPIRSFDVLSIKGILYALVSIPGISWQIFHAMKQADHIHLRCPGNIGLLGCIVQILFPNKPKTAKYAGNWDPKSKQPLSYRLQKWILNNPLLTRNIQVLVYGEWPNGSQNIKPFFTATYSENDKINLSPRKLSETIRFLFVGTLSPGKQPMYALQLVAELKKMGHDVRLDFYGEGQEKQKLEEYISNNNLDEVVILKGNASQDEVKKAYQKSHFLLLPSKSEGWPKVVAEAMFWGCVPVATPVSCVPYMLDFGNRGVILSSDLPSDARELEDLINGQSAYDIKSRSALSWSQQYTLDYFEAEIKKLLLVNSER